LLGPLRVVGRGLTMTGSPTHVMPGQTSRRSITDTNEDCRGLNRRVSFAILEFADYGRI
jgi:hypothetical protein